VKILKNISGKSPEAMQRVSSERLDGIMTDNYVENEARERALGGIGSSEYRAIFGLCGGRE
jgi:hypothetical protein